MTRPVPILSRGGLHHFRHNIVIATLVAPLESQDQATQFELLHAPGRDKPEFSGVRQPHAPMWEKVTLNRDTQECRFRALQIRTLFISAS